MNKRSKLWAILAASVLTLGVVGIALAEELKLPHRNISIDVNGNISGGSETLTASCDLLTVGKGQVGFLFVLSPTSADAGNISVDFTGQPDQGPTAAISNSGSELKWAIVTNLPVTLVDATTDVDGTDANKDELKISHICVNANSSSSSSSSSSTSFSSSQESSTTSVSSSSSSSSTTSFSSSQESTTTSITQPPTDTIGNSGSGNQATGMWLLVAALGVLLGSLVVVAPARAKNKR